MKHFYIITLFLAGGAFVLASVALYQFQDIKEDNDEVYQQIATIQQTQQEASESVNELARIVALSVEGNQELEAQLALEQERRSELEQIAQENRLVFGEQIVSLQSQVASQNLTPLISQWSPRVGRLKCRYTVGDQTGTSNGSAVATVSNGELFFITNLHAVTAEDLEADECSITMIDDTVYEIDGDDISQSEDIDLASLRPRTSASGFSQLNTCATAPQAGDRVVILGYPSVGSDDSITATEGIISGFDDGHYVTSAKIERGNSGGAAIHVQNNCFIGLPTLVFVGRVESLARILPI